MLMCVRKKARSVLLVLLLFLLTTCSPLEFESEMEKAHRTPFDRTLDMSRSEIREELMPVKKKSPTDEKKESEDNGGKSELSFNSEPQVPPFSSVVLAPEPPEVQNKKRVSMTITENVSVKEVLMELSRLSGLELALDPNIKGGIILSVNNRPVQEVLDMVCELAALRYTNENGILKVIKDNPYLVNYNVDYLNLVRSSKGSINTQTQVLSASDIGGGSSAGGGGSSGGSGGGSAGGSGSGSGGLNSGSTNQITTEYDGNLWDSIEKNLVSILDANLDSFRSNEGAGQSSSTPDSAEEVLSRSQSGGGGSGGSGSAGGSSSKVSSYYTINKQAGIISVMANTRKHKIVSEYLNKVKSSMSAQVLIEAKVIEVQLYEEFKTGINWNKFTADRLIGKFDFTSQNSSGSASQFFSGVIGGSDGLSVIGTTIKNGVVGRTADPNKMGAAIKMVEGFGTVRTLSNPRVTVINNQQAVLTFAQNKTYYTVSGTLQTSSTSTNASTGSTTNTALPVSVSSTLHTIPIGVILALQPSVNIETQEVTMHVRPTLSSIAGAGIPDPAVALLSASITSVASTTGQGNDPTIIQATQDALSQNLVPVVQIRELDTVLKARSGDVMIIGGLIQHFDQSIEEGVPFLSKIPFLGGLSKHHEDESSAVETVILIQATIVNPGNRGYREHDKQLYNKFTRDPNPLIFN